MNNQLQPDEETRRGWDEFREIRMKQIRIEIKDLIEMHDRFGDSLQKSYLWKAWHAMDDGVDWFTWARRRALRD